MNEDRRVKRGFEKEHADPSRKLNRRFLPKSSPEPSSESRMRFWAKNFGDNIQQMGTRTTLNWVGRIYWTMPGESNTSASWIYLWSFLTMPLSDSRHKATTIYPPTVLFRLEDNDFQRMAYWYSKSRSSALVGNLPVLEFKRFEEEGMSHCLEATLLYEFFLLRILGDIKFFRNGFSLMLQNALQKGNLVRYFWHRIDSITGQHKATGTLYDRLLAENENPAKKPPSMQLLYYKRFSYTEKLCQVDDKASGSVNFFLRTMETEFMCSSAMVLLNRFKKIQIADLSTRGFNYKKKGDKI